jgi:hypothetical protein
LTNVGCILGAVAFHLAILALGMVPAGILAAGMAVGVIVGYLRIG